MRHTSAPDSRKLPSSPRPGLYGPQPAGRGYWTAYFDALAMGPLLAKPHTARRRAGDMARACPYPEVAAAGLAKVRTALAAQQPDMHS